MEANAAFPLNRGPRRQVFVGGVEEKPLGAQLTKAKQWEICF
jgi:hypothetical protein